MGKAGFITVIGRPSAGKSTFLNKACGHKVSIVSKIPQTTRNKIRGIINREAGQIIFIDTPGLHQSDRKFNQALRNLVSTAIEDSDGILCIQDGSRDFGPEDREILQLLQNTELPSIVAINKTDLSKSQSTIEDRIHEIQVEYPNLDRIVPISALNGDGIEELLTELLEYLPESPPLYPKDFFTDQEPQFRIQEIIREKAITHLKDEVPHALYVDIEDMEIEENPQGQDHLHIRGFIIVERETQKGIVVGKGGKQIQHILKEARKEIRELFPYHPHLDIRVKANAKWRNQDDVVKRITGQ